MLSHLHEQPSGANGIVLKKRSARLCPRISTVITVQIKESEGNSDRKDDPLAERAFNLLFPIEYFTILTINTNSMNYTAGGSIQNLN